MTPDNNDLYFLSRGGEMGALVRSHDWSKTSLGTPTAWPQSLRTALSIILNSKFPMFLFWGEELICFYNDAYRPSLGNNGKHPGILGMKAEDAWPEIWDFIKPLINQVLSTGEAVWFEDQSVPIYRNGKMEDVYWTFSYSPVADESGNATAVFVTCTETTRKVLSTTQLRENEERFRFVLDAGSLGSWQLDLKNFELKASDHFKINFGKPLNQPFTYTQLVDAIHPDDVEKQHAQVLHTIETGSDYNIEYRVIWPDASIHWLNIRGKLRRNQDGEPVSMAGISIDITESVKQQKALQNLNEQLVTANKEYVSTNERLAEAQTHLQALYAELEQNESKFRNIIYQAPIAIAIFEGPEFIINIYNERVLEFWGRTAEQVAGKPLFKVLPESTGQGYEELLESVYETGKRFIANEMPVKILRKGVIESAWINFIYDAVKNIHGEITGVIVVCNEVTEQVKIRMQLESALEQVRLSKEAAQLGMFDMDMEKDTMVWDERCRTLFGISHKNVVTYEGDFVNGLHKDDRSRILEVIKNSFIKSVSNGEYDVEYRTIGAENKQERWVRAKGKVYFDDKDKPKRFIGSVLDITEQMNALKKIEEVVAERTRELNEANSGLQKSNEELAQFAYIASHDLQEPLRKITTFSLMLENSLNGMLDENSNKYLTKIKASSEKMTKLIKDVLAYSQLQKENQVFEETDFNKVLENVLFDFDLLIEQKNAVIESKNLHVIEAIPLQMNQLFTNLIGNALKFVNKETRPVIHVSSTRLDKQALMNYGLPAEANYFRIRVTDNGIGISPEYASKIFNIFQRLNSKTEYEGTGIGLAMCKKIVLNHCGQINIEPAATGGTTFNIILPEKQSV